MTTSVRLTTPATRDCLPPAQKRGRARPRILFTPLALLALVSGSALAGPNPYNSLTVVWTAPGDDGDSGRVTAYQLFYSATPVGGDLNAWWNSVPYSEQLTLLPPRAPAGTLDSMVVTGLTQGTTYYFALVALDEAGNSSGYSNVASGATLPCGAPTSAPASFGAATESTGVRLSWEAASDASMRGLHLYRAVGATSPWSLLRSLPAATTSYVDGEVSPGMTYRYRAAWAGPDIEEVICEGPFSTQAVATIPGHSSIGSTRASGRIHVHPNPSKGPVQVALDVEAAKPLSVRLRVFDMNGHWIATVAEGTYPPGRSTISWDRTGRNGVKLSPGYYELLGTIGTARVRERLLLLP